MPDKDMEGRLQMIEDRIMEASDKIEIQNLLNRYLFYFENGDVERIISCFDLSREDVSLEVSRGKFQGREELLTFYNRRVEIGRLPGAMVEHGEATPCIQIASDKKTARVTMISPGFKCLPQGDSQAWDMGRYYAELIREEDGWKIWHLQWAVSVEGDVVYGWLAQNRSLIKEWDYPLLDEVAMPEDHLEPSDCFVDYYKPDERNHLLPEPPDPYVTWDRYMVTKDTRGY